MNRGLFKLVYSIVLNMVVPASEAVPSRGKTTRIARKHFKNLVALSTVAGFIYTSSVSADTVLPAGINIKTMVGTEITSSDANNINFKQLVPKAIVDYNLLNLGKGQNFNVDMLSTYSMLNRIHDVNPSIINGSVNASGNLYFINTNGIIFGRDSQFNVGSIYAGTLDITNELFDSGFLVPNGEFNPVFELVGAVNKKVVVEKGSIINAGIGGKVLLFAENVENSGIINTPDGQTILAAGKKIYLKDSKDPAGFLVEVEGGGTATNLGQIVAERGNITMMGLAVNQAGILTATTSVRANGSIYLQAPDKLIQQGNQQFVKDNANLNQGIVTLNQGSVTQVLPEYNNKEETSKLQVFSYDDETKSGTFQKSEIKIEASLINIDGTVAAKGGNVSIGSFSDAPTELMAIENSQVARRIYLGDHALVDVSGVDAIAPMSRNQYELQLNSTELADAPILRDGTLFKEVVYFDARKGIKQSPDSLVINLTPLEKLSKLTVAEALTKGGNIKFNASTELSPIDVIISKGAKLDVSGGSTSYEAGTIKESNLLYNGKLIPISNAKTGVAYTGVANAYLDKDVKWNVTRGWDLSGGGSLGWGNQVINTVTIPFKTSIVGQFVDGYWMGDDAGQVDFGQTGNLLLAGTLIGNNRVSLQQLVNQTAPLGGFLNIAADNLVLANEAKQLSTDFTFGQSLGENYQSVISNDFFAQGFNRVGLGGVSIETPIEMKSNGSLDLKGNVNANIIAHGSNINFSGDTTIADNVSIVTAGNFTNDIQGLSGALTQMSAINGGNITAATPSGLPKTLTLGNNVLMDTSAGERIGNNGQVVKGAAGSISYVEQSRGNNVKQQAFGFDKGGEYKVSFLKPLNIAGDINKSNNDFDLDKSFFSEGGFSKFSLTGDINIGDVGQSTQEISAIAKTWQNVSGIMNLSNSQDMSNVANLEVLPDVNRKPVSLSFTSGILNLAENTTIRTDIGGNVSLKASLQVNVMGKIITPNGNILIDMGDSQSTEPFNPTQNIFIGEHALLSAVGTSQPQLDSKPDLLNNKIYNAGSIKVTAQQGATVVKEGAEIDVSGASVVTDTKTVSGYRHETLYGDAGIITFSGGLLLDGTLKGAASGSGRAGSLDMGTDLLTQQKRLQADGFFAGFALAETRQLSALSVEQIKQGGFANLTIRGDGQLESGLDLTVVGNVSLNRIKVNDNGIANINANQIKLGNGSTSEIANVEVGSGQISLNSKQFYIDGNTSIAGVNKTEINAALDIHGHGSLVTNGELDLTSRQIYPNSGFTLGLKALGDGGQVNINSNGITSKPILSAQGKLNIDADNITQNGVLSAPFGEVNLNAKDVLTLMPGSITSISANNQNIPFGMTNTNGSRFVSDQYDPLDSRITLLDKHITLKADKVDLQNSAVIDLSAGGDIFAYEFIPGIGGSGDVLLQKNSYAILPSLGSEFAPVDSAYQASSVQQVGVGQMVFLTGVPGLATGSYTLLPARYALVPGAFLVQANPVGNKLLPNQIVPQLDGSTLTTGFFGNLSNEHDANWSTFKVTDGSIFHTKFGEISKAPSEYKLTSATEFFGKSSNVNNQQVSLPVDIGKLGLDATKLNLDSTITANKVNGGKGLEVDISAKNIRLVSNKGADDGSLQLTASSLNALNAESVLLGGSRKFNNDMVEVTTTANSVSIENDATQVVNTPELIMSAKNNIIVKVGAAIDTGVASKEPEKLRIASDGEGVFLAMSSKNDINYSRKNGAGAVQGDLNIEVDSKLKAGNSIVLDTTKSGVIAGEVKLQDGGVATFGAKGILLGNAPIGTAGLNVNATVLDSLGQLKSMTLNSYNNIDTYGAISFGNNNLDLTIDAAGIAGHLAEGETLVNLGATPQNSIITSKNFTLKNSSDATFGVPLDIVRGLEINAVTVKLEGKDATNTNANAGNTQIAGYTDVVINAGEIHTLNAGEINFNVANTKLTSGQIIGEAGSNYTIKTDNRLETTNLANAILSTQTSMGAVLNIQANDLNIGSHIDLASGKITLKASNDLNITSGANLSTKSANKVFAGLTETAPAGTIILASSNGNVNVNEGALVDVSSTNSADAGFVKISAKSGTANISGDINGAANGSGKGGGIEVDVNTLADLNTTNSNAVGFNEARHYRVRNGDVNIVGVGNNALIARDVNVSADTGKITVAGDIIATSPKNSHIGLFAGNGVKLTNAANLIANSTNAEAEGGKVEIATKAGVLELESNSIIDVRGGVEGVGGNVNLRTPRIGNAENSLAGNVINSSFLGPKSITLEAVNSFNDITKISSGNSNVAGNLGFTTIANDVDNFMTNKDLIIASLGKTNDSIFHLRASETIISSSNLEVSNDWNLYLANRKADEPGILSLLAVGNLNIKGSISDGFETTTPAAKIGIGDSWTYNLVAGADLNAANILVVKDNADNVSLNLANDKLIRTGTGSINIAADGNLIMGNAGSVIYTAGFSPPPLEGFDAPIATQNPLYLTSGGDVSINVKGDIVGKESSSDVSTINEWMYRQGSKGVDTSWWVRPDKFKQSLATFGGGDILLNAGGSIKNFSAAVATTARFDTYENIVDSNGNITSRAVVNGNQVINGGGDLTINAVEDINNGVYFVGKGEGLINAGGSIIKKTGNSGTSLAIQDGSFKVNVAKDAYIETVSNPTLVKQSLANNTNLNLSSYFNSYDKKTTAEAASLSGSITFGGGGGPQFYPSKLKAIAFNGNINVKNATLLPGPDGDLNLLAANNITLGTVVMSDESVTSLPSVSRTMIQSALTNFPKTLLDHDPQLLHKNDNNPALIVANTGDISGTGYINLAKSAQLVAGRDIKDISIGIQNNHVSDIALIKAGNDIKTQDVVVSGVGELLLLAGNNIDLVKDLATSVLATGSGGFNENSIGNNIFTMKPNPVLGSEGASITMQAGLNDKNTLTNVQNYINQYILPSGVGPLALVGNPDIEAEYHAATTSMLTKYMQKITGDSNLSDAEALVKFNDASQEIKTIFSNRHLSTELLASGQDFAKTKTHVRGDEAYAMLFPDSNHGNILLFNSKVATNSGGSIDLLATGGGIVIGIPGKGGDIGVITEKGGAIRAIADKNIDVNQSKVITQFGSNISIYSNNGDVDAGRGSKTATSVPVRIVSTDVDGNTNVEVRGVATGSGIRAQSYDPDGPNSPLIEPKKGKVFLGAPRGAVNAGEAGIEAGDLLIVAPIVLNAGNIQVQGESSGIPVASTSGTVSAGVGLSPDSVNSVTAAVAQNVAQSASQSYEKPTLPSIISVDIISIGK